METEPAWYVDMLVGGLRLELEAAADIGDGLPDVEVTPADTLESWR